MLEIGTNYEKFNGKITVDNIAVVKKYTSLREIWPYSFKSINESDSDVIKEYIK